MDFELSRAVAVLERTPDALNAMFRGLPNEWTDPNEGPDTWSAKLVVAHLVYGERTDWIVRARTILAQGPNRRFTPFDRKGHYALAADRSLEALLDQFAEGRAASLATLRSWKLDDDKLALCGVHPEFGDVALRQLLASWVVHDLGHIGQASRVMAKQYREAVGPWAAYLSVLTR